LVLMDITLAGIWDGIHTAEMIHQHSDIPIIFLTAYSDKPILERAKLTNPLGYIIKPFKDRELFSHIELALHTHQLETKLKESNLLLLEQINNYQRAEEEKLKLINKLKKINTDLEDFSIILSHDLKAPVANLNLGLNVLSKVYGDQLDQEGKNFIVDLTQSVDYLQKLLIDQVKYMVIGWDVEHKKEVSLKSILDKVKNILKIPDNINIRSDERLPSVLCDEVLICQVFQNLLENSIKFMDKTQGEIEITCQSDNGSWEIEVSDNGPGIEERYLNKIFDMYFRLRKDVDGTGTGLSLVKKIVEAHGGNVRVKSKPTIGTSIIFNLPND
ncbi:MAG: ATP-binding protein, partial [Spirochaetota bacterium]|nr:ATP-binding protein [Spirochaetota bacterium]